MRKEAKATDAETSLAWREMNDGKECSLFETYYGLISCKLLTYLDSFRRFHVGTVQGNAVHFAWPIVYPGSCDKTTNVMTLSQDNWYTAKETERGVHSKVKDCHPYKQSLQQLSLQQMDPHPAFRPEMKTQHTKASPLDTVRCNTRLQAFLHQMLKLKGTRWIPPHFLHKIPSEEVNRQDLVNTVVEFLQLDNLHFSRENHCSHAYPALSPKPRGSLTDCSR
ncbi:hypothetical protein A6R68_12847 [Neotoma lepida]|uniref:Uncharacterized protein n=1 Tax=Neotoma lepida TaxID=56216 RepID=A0A1A6H422_NEOLE|nr:hypothetical protein A6R68_12847 [Neotoma lepida]